VVRFDWDALQAGDRVLVHDAGKADMALVAGVVAMVNWRKGSNGVGIRVGPTDERVILWPARLAVHRDPREPTEPCWRCDAPAGVGPDESAENLQQRADRERHHDRRSA
jgi:hypothetical protein